MQNKLYNLPYYIYTSMLLEETLYNFVYIIFDQPFVELPWYIKGYILLSIYEKKQTVEHM